MFHKKALSFGLAFLLSVGFAGCGQKSGGKQPGAKEVVDAVSATLTFQDDMKETPTDRMPVTFRYDESQVSDKASYASATMVTASEVTVFKASDAKYVDSLKAVLEERIEDQKIQYEDYQPQEMEKINNAVIYTNGDYLILVMADDTSSVKSTFDAQF